MSRSTHAFCPAAEEMNGQLPMLKGQSDWVAPGLDDQLTRARGLQAFVCSTQGSTDTLCDRPLPPAPLPPCPPCPPAPHPFMISPPPDPGFPPSPVPNPTPDPFPTPDPLPGPPTPTPDPLPSPEPSPVPEPVPGPIPQPVPAPIPQTVPRPSVILLAAVVANSEAGNFTMGVGLCLMHKLPIAKTGTPRTQNAESRDCWPTQRWKIDFVQCAGGQCQSSGGETFPSARSNPMWALWPFPMSG